MQRFWTNTNRQLNESCPFPVWDAVWVARVEGGNDACRTVAHRLASLVEEITSVVCTRSIPSSHPNYQGYANRLWACIEYHWRQDCQERPLRLDVLLEKLGVDGSKVSTPKDNLLAEVLLAQSLEAGDDRSAQWFEQEYAPIVRAVARRIGGQRAVEGVDNFAAELMLPRESSPPRIATFRGRTTLAQWLVPVVSNYWRGMVRRKQFVSLEPELEPADAACPIAPAEGGCEELLQPIFVQSIRVLTSEDRVLITMLLLDDVPQGDLARSMGLHTGTLTRRRQKAVEGVFKRVRELASANPERRRVDHCLEAILAGDDPELRSQLADVLAEGIRKSANDSQEVTP